jgi:hypothetical protein
MNLQKYVPALQHLAKNYGCSLTYVAMSRGIPLSELQGVIDTHFESRANLDEDSFDAWVEKHGLTKLASTRLPVGGLPAANAMEPSPRDKFNRAMEVTEQKERELWEGLTFKPGTVGHYRPVLEDLTKTPWETVSVWLRANRYPVSYGAFYAFSLKAFKTGGIHPGRVQRFIAWAEGKGLLAKRDPEWPQATAKSEKPKAESPAREPTGEKDTSAARTGETAAHIKPATPTPVTGAPEKAPAPVNVAPEREPVPVDVAYPEPHEVMREHAVLDGQAGFKVKVSRLEQFLALAHQHFRRRDYKRAREALEFAADNAHGAAAACEVLEVHGRPC